MVLTNAFSSPKTVMYLMQIKVKNVFKMKEQSGILIFYYLFKSSIAPSCNCIS